MMSVEINVRSIRPGLEIRACEIGQERPKLSRRGNQYSCEEFKRPDQSNN